MADKEPTSESEQHPERHAEPAGRDTPVMGPPKERTKVKPIDGEPAIDRPYDPGEDKRPPEDPWQDPGGAEPANG